MSKLIVDSSGVRDLLQKLSRLKDLKDPYRTFHAYMVRETDMMFRKAGGQGSALNGGKYRGQEWDPFSKKYMNRKRPSGKRVSPVSLLMQDTGTLRQRAATEVVRVTPSSLMFGTRLKYAKRQNKMRPFLFITEKDADIFLKMVDLHLRGGNK